MDNVNATTVIWKRLDIPGHEACRVVQLADGWQVSGVAVLAHEDQACRLDYTIDCDSQWMTKSTEVKGWVGERVINVTITRGATGDWKLNGSAIEGLEGCSDIDLNFSPSTNLLPIRRLNLADGESATVLAAWLRFPSFALEPLEQSYTRLSSRLYRYESAGGKFVAEVTLDEAGLAIDYGDIWTRETADSAT